MGWNHRVMRHPPDPPRGEHQVWYAIHEVFYLSDEVDDRAVDPSEVGATAEPVAVVGDDIDDLRWTLTRMLEALDKPVLDYRE